MADGSPSPHAMSLPSVALTALLRSPPPARHALQPSCRSTRGRLRHKDSRSHPAAGNRPTGAPAHQAALHPCRTGPRVCHDDRRPGGRTSGRRSGRAVGRKIGNEIGALLGHADLYVRPKIHKPAMAARMAIQTHRHGFRAGPGRIRSRWRKRETMAPSLEALSWHGDDARARVGPGGLDRS